MSVSMRSEHGSVSIVLAAGILVVLVLTMGVADLGHVLAARARARSGADAAALAVAQELAFPTGRDPAEVAADYAMRNRTVLISCACASGAFDVTVEVRTSVGALALFPGSLEVTQRARAVVDLPSGTP
ncbi:MAG TPA: Rv3654c family TadE-like protein [Actinomycetota bacterium]|nr:Rv3654c family TadE-like protein [Actinomycetota bacterium]